MSLTKKIDFAIIIHVKNANPNGDPLNGNRPRTDYEGLGEITDVCIKRKIRDRLQDNGNLIFVQSDDRKIDNLPSLEARAKSDQHGLGENAFKEKDKETYVIKPACEKWLDVRAFGQIFPYKASKKTKKDKTIEANNTEYLEKGESDASGISIAIRGPVSIQSAFSIEPISISSTQITKSVNGEGDGTKKSSDTMGMKHRVDSGIYVLYGSMNPQLAERTKFSDNDAAIIKQVLPKLFENDASSARPEGSMAVSKVFWWEHNCKAGQHSSAKVHNTLKVQNDGTYVIDNLHGLEPEIIEGF